MKHRKNSVARAIQDFFLNEPYDYLKTNPDGWAWLEIPNNPSFCVALEWQNGYEGDEWDKKHYGIFGDEANGEFWVINASIKMTDEFRINGNYAYYAETYFGEPGEDIEGGISLTQEDKENQFYNISKALANDFNRFNRMKRKYEDDY